MSSPFGENDLTDAADLGPFPGAPFSAAEVDAAVAAVRNAVGWHVAPVRDDVMVLSPDGHRLLRLPTLRLLAVSEIRDVVSDIVIDASTYRLIASRNAVLKTSGWWPHGLDRIEVDCRHGFDECPADLLPVIAEAAVWGRREQGATTLTAGPFSMQLSSTADVPLSAAETLDTYRLWQLGAA